MKNKTYILIFAGLAILILWQMLLPGYVLSLDMVFAPQMPVTTMPGALENSSPIFYLMHLASLVMPAWFVQKIILFILFFLLFYIPFGFLPISGDFPKFVAAIFYAVNPFVYSRFLAGHWMVLFGYAFLPFFIYCLFNFIKKQDFKSACKLFTSIFLINLFSIHFFVMAMVVTAGGIGVGFLRNVLNSFKQEAPLPPKGGNADDTRLVFKSPLGDLGAFKKFIKNFFLAGLLFVIFSSYWIIPAALRTSPLEKSFGVEQWEVFSAAGHGKIGTALNVASLNGFWSERYAWAKYFSWPQEHAFFWIAFAIIFVLMVVGIWKAWQYASRDQRFPRDAYCEKISGKGETLGAQKGLTLKRDFFNPLFFLSLAIFSFIFATGVGDTVFKTFNLWFYEHIPFWSGFRDSQKFVGFLALSYSVFFGWGVEAAGHMALRIPGDKIHKGCVMPGCNPEPNLKTWIPRFGSGMRDVFKSVILLAVIFFGFFVWGGFQRQLRPVWYPDDWQKAKEILLENNIENGEGVLVLPWHGYFSLRFNNYLVTANPGQKFFGNAAIVNDAVETGVVYSQDNQSTDILEMDDIVRGDFDPDEAMELLKAKGVKYIVYFQDLKGQDNLDYIFLESKKIKKVFEDGDVVMYEIGGEF